MRAHLSWLLVVVVLALPAAAGAQQSPSSCTAAGENLWMRDVMTDLYLWYREMPPVNPTRYASPEDYLEAVRYWPLDSHFSYITDRASNDALFSDSQFVGVGLSTSTTGTDMRVSEVYPDSPASEAGLARGDRIAAINGRTIAELVAAGALGSAFGPAEIGVSVDLLFEHRDGTRVRATAVKRLVTIPTVSRTEVYEVDGRKVGHIFFRNFVRPSTAALNEAFATLHEAGVTELVLDLRYNGGGLVSVAQHLASLIGGALTDGQVFASYRHNDRNAFRDEDLRFDTPANALGLSRLIVITTEGSASASELVINGLRPFIDVVLIGDRTYGKPVGQYAIPFCDKVLAAVAFSMRNADDVGDYFDGLPATCAAPDDLEHELGDADEGSLAEALFYAREGRCSTASALRAKRAPERAARPLKPIGWQALLGAH